VHKIHLDSRTVEQRSRRVRGAAPRAYRLGLQGTIGGEPQFVPTRQFFQNIRRVLRYEKK
jgi:hypothetical protein